MFQCIHIAQSPYCIFTTQNVLLILCMHFLQLNTLSECDTQKVITFHVPYTRKWALSEEYGTRKVTAKHRENWWTCCWFVTVLLQYLWVISLIVPYTYPGKCSLSGESKHFQAPYKLRKVRTSWGLVRGKCALSGIWSEENESKLAKNSWKSHSRVPLTSLF